MTTFAPTADSRYIHAIRGGAYARSIESKTRKVCGFSHQSQKAVVGGQPTGNLSNVYGVSLSASVVLLASKITNLLMQRNNQTAQMAPTCVRIIPINRTQVRISPLRSLQNGTIMVIRNSSYKCKAPSARHSTARCDHYAVGGRNVMQLNHTPNLSQEQSTTDEIWLPVPDYEGVYEVSNYGRVMRVSGGMGAQVGKVLSPGITKLGYKIVGLTDKGIRKSRSIHSLVALAFIGPRPKGWVINHLDSNPSNNHLSNLEYTTYKGNYSHAVKKGRMDHILHSPEMVQKAKEMYASKSPRYSLQQIADELGLVKSQIYNIVKGKYKTDKLRGLSVEKLERESAKVPSKIRKQIIEHLLRSWKTGRIAKKFDIAPMTVRRIRDEYIKSLAVQS